MRRIDVIIVDDSAAARRALSSLLSDDPGINVRATAADPFEAAELLRRGVPDVIILDLELPRMSGLTFLSKIMKQHPIPVLICSSHTDANSKAAMRALELGACDVIGKPRMGTAALRHEAQIRLTDAVRAAAQTGRVATPSRTEKPGHPPGPALLKPDAKLTADAILPGPRANAPYPRNLPALVAIGASTGGTEALSSLLPELPASTPPILIVLHMPEKFTAAFAKRLNGLCRVEVREAVHGERVLPGTVLIAPGDQHLLVKRQGQGYRVELVSGPYVCRHRPSVDVLFRSTAISAGYAALGVLLTGMGDDGARGLLEMRNAGADTIAQDEATSVVWGMPGEAANLGAARRIRPLSSMAAEIAAHRPAEALP
ncbi:Chemotaxis response regulator protein-glutamate methylesterase of group 3 operon [Roseivivax jejudonensis]|uniref:Protein-glutamate methylesterase/protein-glutamine glutaminase n=1 Tax=Roseivivax jejudonensis TaxID=1529041 RepID=A0A1X6YK80_9RHOB|nr:chemotaxis response regulator protein-glutamate methylesterase [Roseivivax jejudonensis]SLN23528.1 Chemotaxis response regulator protein-glutamate methylesterase of group 3 operon [Roseivivax jejudonensis]